MQRRSFARTSNPTDPIPQIPQIPQPRVWRLAAIALLALWLPAAALAAGIPGLPQTAAPAAPAPAKPADGSKAIQAELDEARRDAAVVENSPNYAANAPANAPDEELKLRRYFLREAVRSYENLLRATAQQGQLRQQLEDAKRQTETWTSLETPPPYSVLLADRLAQAAVAAQNRVKSLDYRQDLIAGLRDAVSNAARANAATVRQAEEQLAQAPPERKVAIAWSLELARQRLRAQSAIIRSLEVSDENNQLNLSIAQQEAALAKRKADSTKGRIVFEEADYERIKADLVTEGRDLSNRLSAAVDKANAATARLDQARQAMAGAEAALASDYNKAVNAAVADKSRNLATLDGLRQEIVLAEQQLASANAVLDGLRYAPTVIEMKRAIWDLRYRLHRDKTPELVAEIKVKLKEISSVMALMLNINERQLGSVMRETLALEKALGSADSLANRPLLQKQLGDLTGREQELRLIGAFFSAAQSLLDALNGEVGGQAAEFSLVEKATTTAIEGKTLLQTFWNYELFVAEDTIEVDGKKVTGYSSITIGKVSRALIIFTAGVLLTLWLARIGEAIVVRRFGYDAARARILRKWLYTLGLLVLLVLVLTWVNIPLTIFAFLGGAVAIGLGFGMQNVLKNLISGLMLLFERPFKPGDLVEVGTLRGNVTEIGIRSSTIRDSNGVDTMIPNSLFVEQSVTNWTYDPKVRFCVKVGVAYGCPVRDVAELLAACVARHGLILTDPEPEILFENFGADSLEFGVYFWLEIVPGVTGRRVCSDLRFIIEKALTEKGIVISYPQRDVHLDAAAPLKIELVGAGKASGDA